MNCVLSTVSVFSPCASSCLVLPLIVWKHGEQLTNIATSFHCIAFLIIKSAGTQHVSP